MQRKRVFKVQGIVCLVAVIVMGVLALLSPVRVNVKPSEATVKNFIAIAAETGDDSEEMEAWIGAINKSLEPAKEYTKEESEELLQQIIQAELDEAEERENLALKAAEYKTVWKNVITLEMHNDPALDEMRERLASLKEELDELFKDKQVAESVKLKKTETKGVDMSVPLFDFLTNIGGSINAVSLIGNYTSYSRVANRIADSAIPSESDLTELKRLLEYITNPDSYEGVNVSALNVALFAAPMIERINSDDAQDSFGEGDRYLVMYNAVYEEILQIDTKDMALMAVWPLVCGWMFYVCGVIGLLFRAVSALLGAVLRLKNPEKMYAGAVRSFGKTLLDVVLLCAATVWNGGVLSATGVIILILAVGVSILNGVAVRTGNLTKEEHMWLNFSQGAGVIGAAFALTVVLLLGAGNPFSSWNASILCLLKKGVDFQLAAQVLSVGTFFAGVLGILTYALIMMRNLSAVACIGSKKKSDAALRTRQNVVIVIAELVTVALVAFLIVMKMPLSETAVFTLIAASVLFVLNIVRRRLCAKYAAGVSKDGEYELERCAVLKTEN